MNKHDVLGPQRVNKLGCLRKVRMRRKRNVVHRHAEWELVPVHRHNL